MLYSFTPTKGSKANQTYYLPRVLAPYTTGGSINPMGDEMQQMPNQSGMFPVLGSRPMNLGSADLNPTFEIHSGWLKNNKNNGGRGYDDSPDGRDAAIDDFVYHVLMGGMGTLVDQNVTGTIVKTAEAWASGQYQIIRQNHNRAQIVCVLSVMSGLWRVSSGGYIYVN